MVGVKSAKFSSTVKSNNTLEKRNIGLLILFTSLFVAFVAFLYLFNSNSTTLNFSQPLANAHLDGAVTVNGISWEHHLVISADPSQQQIRAHITFDKYKPSSCRDGIYVETADGQPVPFSTENELYEDGLCKETDVVFKNSLSGPAKFEIQSEQPSQQYIIYYGLVSTETTSTQQSIQFETLGITGCTNITTSGVYTLDRDIQVSGYVGPCININASNVVLDGQGHNISCSGLDCGTAIRVYLSMLPLSNVSIKNINFNGWTTAIDFSASSGEISGNVIYGQGTGVSVRGNNINISSNNISSNQITLKLLSTSNVNVSANSFTSYGDGGVNIFVNDSNNCFFENNFVSGRSLTFENTNNTFLENVALSGNLVFENTNNASLENITLLGNLVVNETTGFNGTNFALDYANISSISGADFVINRIGIESVPEPPLAELKNISVFVNATNITQNSWLFLNLTYPEPEFDEGTLIFARYNGSWELNCSAFSSFCEIDKTNNIISANITDFGSLFTPLGGAYLIYDCTNLDTPGYYYLMNDLVCGGGINIESSNIILNGLGKYIACSGNGNAGALNIVQSLSNLTVFDIVLGAEDPISSCGYGVYVTYGNTLYNSTLQNLTTKSPIYSGLALWEGDNISVYYSNISGVSWTQYAVVGYVNNSQFIGNLIHDCIDLVDITGDNNLFIDNYFWNPAEPFGSFWHDFVRLGGNNNSGYENTFEYLDRIVKFNFSQSGNVQFRYLNTSNLPPDPSGLRNISGKYLNISGAGWLYLALGYSDKDIENISESSLRIAKYSDNGIWYTNCEDFSSSCGVDVDNNVIWANITNFGSVFVPLGNTSIPVSDCMNITDSGNYYLTGDLLNKAVDICINISAPNVFFDGRGYKIDGVDVGKGIGIYQPFAPVTVYNVELTDWNEGVYIAGGSGITLDKLSIHDNVYYGIHGESEIATLNSPVINNSQIFNNRQNWETVGVYLAGAEIFLENNNISMNSQGLKIRGGVTIFNTTFYNNTGYDAYFNRSSGSGDLVDFGSAQVNFEFDFDNSNLSIKGIFDNLPADPENYTNISKYLNITADGSGWLNLGMLYNDSDLRGDIKEHTLRIARYNDSGWEKRCSSFANSCGVDTVNNYVYANITDFGSIFAPLGQIQEAGVCNCSNCTDCMNKLNDPSCTEVRLNTSIYDQAGTCIDNPENFSNKIFDCQGYTIDGDGAGNDYGIYLNDVNGYKNNDTIKNCIITDFDFGIELYSYRGENGYPENVHNNSIVNNEVKNCGHGIDLHYAPNNVLANNILNNNLIEGIALISSSNNNITNNTANSNLYGIYLQSSSNNTIIDNVANNSWKGIYVYYSDYNFLTNNTANNNDLGIHIHASNNNNLINNTANNNREGIECLTPASNNNLINNTANNNTNYGIYLYQASNNTLTNNTANNNSYHGIYLYLSDYNTLTDNLAVNNSFNGIDISFSSNNNLTNNTVSGNNYGVYFGPSNSNANVIANNTLNLNNYGFYLESSNYNNFTFNNITSNTITGISISGSTGNYFENNSVIGPQQNGIYIDGSNQNTFKSNTISSSSETGIILSEAVENSFIENIIESNTKGFEILQSNYTNLTGNEIKWNDQIGIYVYSDSHFTEFTNNKLYGNNLGLKLDSSDNIFRENLYYNNSVREAVLNFDNNTFANELFAGETLDKYPTRASFFGIEVNISGVNVSIPDPNGYRNISKYLNITGNSSSWLFLNISYNDSDLNGIDESTLRIAKYSGGTWETNCSVFANSCGVDTVNNYVYANITNFGSIFAPLGQIQEAGVCNCSSCDDCKNKLNDPSCTEVRLNTSIYNQARTCIDNPANFSNKIFDCQGHIIEGNSIDENLPDAGIYIVGKTGNTIKNCIITKFRMGILLSSSSNNNVVTNITANDNTYHGIHLYYSSNNTITNNTANNNGNYGIFSYSSSNNTIASNIANNNSEGILLESSSNNTITNNTANINSYGILLSSSSNNNVVTNNTANNNYYYGIALSYSSNNTIENNGILNNSIGIFSEQSNSTINRNVVCGNTQLDFNSSDWLSSYGSNNTCSNPDGWNDTGTTGCTYRCGGAPQPACNLTVLINGAQVSNFTNAGEPYNVTVLVDQGGSPINAYVAIEESNGYSIFVMPQFQESNISVGMRGETSTGADGIVSFTAVPTGGMGINSEAIGSYNITVRAYIDEVECNNTSLEVTYPNLPEPSGKVSPPNIENIRYFKDKVAIAYLRIKDWLAAGGGEIVNLTVWMNNGSYESSIDLSNLTAGKPYGFNVRVLYDSDPVANAEVCFVERNGFPPFILPQYVDSNVSNYAYGCGKTNSNGELNLTIVLTGGVGINSGAIGSYGAWVDVVGLDMEGVRVNLGCGNNCNFPEASGSTTTIPNQENIRWFKDQIAKVYLRIRDWLAG